MELKIGDSMFRYISMSGIHKFTVIGVHQYETVCQYVVRDENCNHGWKCEMLITKDSKGKYRYSSMVNDNDDDSQEYWHNDASFFYTTLDGCKSDHYKLLIREKKADIEKFQGIVKQKITALKELEDLLATFNKT